LCVIRQQNLAKVDYLVQQIHGTPNIEVRLESKIAAGERLETANNPQQEQQYLRYYSGQAVFCADRGDARHRLARWRHLTQSQAVYRHRTVHRPDASPLQRKPMSCETSVLGIFAVSDVRLGSMKRVASSVRKGSAALKNVHGYMKEIEIPNRGKPSLVAANSAA
jgi:thioredoxin reductase (NADPH)